ncbi:glycoside hydrolase family 9 protein [Marinoscillum sp.]|uniref:glycoside hydrolase family 9 protein n=1 Tax=Marinoscillum sp. TaxID=2024838 RepID=UPI003BAAB1FD
MTGTLRSFLSFTLLTLLMWSCAFMDKSSQSDPNIRLNQVGFYPNGQKLAIIVGPQDDSFELKDKNDQTVFTSEVLPAKYWDQSGENASILDFSAFSETGEYYLQNGNIKSALFTISEQPYTELLKSAAKTYYFNRATTELQEEYAGVYKRPFSHPDTTVLIHASAAGDFISAGTSISTPFGWYDAGDFNKYIVNSGISTYTLLTSYQHYQTLFDTLEWNIPESNNSRADLLDEILWNIKWMETMQDTLDGGVYHKTTTANFEGFMEASKASAQRFVVTKGTAASLNFAAVMAKASVVYKSEDSVYSQQLLNRAKAAWNWAQRHPNAEFKNPVSNSPKYPSIHTGEYGDNHFQDEFFWAGAELYLATMDMNYLQAQSIDEFSYFNVPNWATVETLGLISLASSDLNNHLKKKASDQLMVLAERLISDWRESPYRVTINKFVWGSNAEVMNQSMVLLNAYRVLGNVEYFEAAVSGLDYVLGRNATGYCFVTGYGQVSPMNIHHRQSASDNIDQPIPGFLVGGPNPRNIHQDCGADEYPVHLPAKCYLDEVCSYSTNEVAINWNAPLVYVTAGVQSIYRQRFSK